MNRTEDGEKQTNKRRDEESISSSESSDLEKECDDLGDGVGKLEKTAVGKVNVINVLGRNKASNVRFANIFFFILACSEILYKTGNVPTNI